MSVLPRARVPSAIVVWLTPKVVNFHPLIDIQENQSNFSSVFCFPLHVVTSRNTRRLLDASGDDSSKRHRPAAGAAVCAMIH